jgi:hypothetical protein
MSAPNEEVTTTAQTYRQLMEFLRHEPDMTLGKIVSDWFFQPANRFDPTERTRMKPEILILLSYLFLMAVVFAAFNLSR